MHYKIFSCFYELKGKPRNYVIVFLVYKNVLKMSFSLHILLTTPIRLFVSVSSNMGETRLIIITLFRLLKWKIFECPWTLLYQENRYKHHINWNFQINFHLHGRVDLNSRQIELFHIENASLHLSVIKGKILIKSFKWSKNNAWIQHNFRWNKFYVENYSQNNFPSFPCKFSINNNGFKYNGSIV